MITLRRLASSEKNEYSLDQWIELAEKAGINPDPDAEIDTGTLITIRAYMSQCAQEKEEEKKEQARREEKSRQSMEKLISENYIFTDISSLLAPEAEKAFSTMAPMLMNARKKINIPELVMSELYARTNDHSDEECRKLAIRHYKDLVELNRRGMVSVRKTLNPNCTNSAQDLYTMCAHFRLQAPLLVITQDEKMAADLMALNSQRSANGNTITVKKINKYGFLSNTIDKPKDAKPFTICTTVRSGKDKQIPVSFIPGENDMVYSSPDLKGEIRLAEKMGGGGEGSVYRTNTPYVAKIYKEECCTEYRFEKITKMINAGLSFEGICFPIASLYNRMGQPVGYLMPEAKGYSIQSSIFRKPLFLQKLPGWKKEDLVQCAITILKKIEYLHNNNILIGDINPNNFLVVSPKEVYLVDTDSFQIDDLPCPVGVPLYTAPEIHMKHRQGAFTDYSEILRTKENEYFAVATLIFELMLPGKPPYTQQGGEDIVDNILEMHFPYAVGERHGENVPDGTWRYIWSHLTRKMKENFLQVFNKEDGKSEFNIAERLTVDQWKKELLEYRKVIQTWKKELESNPLSLEADPLSLELYPNRLKHQRNKQYVICKGEGCGKEYAVDDPALKAGFCPECQRKGTPTKCWSCGAEFTFTNYDKYFRKMTTAPLLCPDCRKTKDEVVYSKTCAAPGCTNKIEYNKGDLAYAYFKADKDGYTFEFPKLCKECKKKGIKLKPSDKSSSGGASSGRTSSSSGGSSSGRTSSSSGGASSGRTSSSSGGASSGRTSSSSGGASSGRSSSGTSGCFITTAVCGYLGKPDDCEELTAFRSFRDNWLIHQPEGKELVEEYYRTAPELVKRMNESPAYASICQTLWDQYLVPCHHMILEEKYEECKIRYIDMVHYLTSTLDR